MRALVLPAIAALALAWPAGGTAQERLAGYLPEDYSCIMCHTDKRSSFVLGVHAARGIVCADCHGGDPTAFERESAHSRGGLERSGYRGPLSKQQAVGLCLSCHGDLTRMRQFGLPAVTRADFLISRHGQRLLLAGDTAAPSCSNCHGSHAIFAGEDARSTIHTARVSETCAGCHAERARIPAGMPVDQYQQWWASAHGIALRDGNSRSATCVACHESHTALPPGVSEVANVCGKCHTLERDAFFRGPHAAVASGSTAPDTATVTCIACHGSHGTGALAPEGIGALCGRCHAADSPAGVAAVELQQQLVAGERADQAARDAIDRLVAAGEETRDEQVRLLTLRTELQQLRVAAHALDVESAEELGRRVESLSREIREQADIVAEERWERKLLVIPLWLGVLAGVALAVRKRRVLSRSAHL
ncbi:MAG: cytochrome c3 family protein [Gemmatimonadetes bacterium]|nr:cytochrome c3 family protein [Gemmatimonadota bacterium]